MAEGKVLAVRTKQPWGALRGNLFYFCFVLPSCSELSLTKKRQFLLRLSFPAASSAFTPAISFLTDIRLLACPQHACKGLVQPNSSSSGSSSQKHKTNRSSLCKSSRPSGFTLDISELATIGNKSITSWLYDSITFPSKCKPKTLQVSCLNC